MTSKAQRLLWSDLMSNTSANVDQLLFDINLDFWKAANAFGFERPRRLPVSGTICRHDKHVLDGYLITMYDHLQHAYTIGLEKGRSNSTTLHLRTAQQAKISINNITLPTVEDFDSAVESNNSADGAASQGLGSKLFDMYRKHAGLLCYENLHEVVLKTCKGPNHNIDAEGNVAIAAAARDGFLTKSCYKACVRNVINEHKRVASLFAGRYSARPHGIEDLDADGEYFDAHFYDKENFNQDKRAQQLKVLRENIRRLDFYTSASWLFTS